MGCGSPSVGVRFELGAEREVFAWDRGRVLFRRIFAGEN